MYSIDRGKIRGMKYVQKIRQTELGVEAYRPLNLNVLSSFRTNESIDGRIQTKHKDDAKRLEELGIEIGERLYVKTEHEEICGFYVGTSDSCMVTSFKDGQYHLEENGLLLLLNTKPNIGKNDTGNKVLVRDIKEIKVIP